MSTKNNSEIGEHVDNTGYEGREDTILNLDENKHSLKCRKNEKIHNTAL
jgi:hypothetical protein